MKYAYYNEFEPYAAEWLRRLIRDGHIAPGYVDERSILDVSPDDLREFGQCHFFAGLGGWSFALRLAGVSDEEPVWTGSCPCQPFSVAGKGKGTKDERHLWPVWFKLIQACQPNIIFGEQVSGPSVNGAIGKNYSQMLQVLAGKEVLRFLQERGCLSDVPMGAAKSETRPRPREVSADKQCFVKASLRRSSAESVNQGEDVPPKLSRRVFDEVGEEPSDTIWPSLRSGPERHSTESESGGVRDDRHSVRSDLFGESVERAVVRPDRSGSGLHETKYESDSVFFESGDEHLGRAGGSDARQGFARTASREVKRIIESFRGEIERQTESSWLAAVQLQLERAGYRLGAAVFPAAGVGAPHGRHRTYWLADAQGGRDNGALWHHQREGVPEAMGRSAIGGVADPDEGERRRRASDDGRQRDGADSGWPEDHGFAAGRGGTELLADGDDEGLEGRRRDGNNRGEPRRVGTVAGGSASETRAVVGLADALHAGRPEGRTGAGNGSTTSSGGTLGLADAAVESDAALVGGTQRTGPANGDWRDPDWLFCRDGKWRPVEPGTFPLATRIPARVGKLRAYGNSIVPQAAVEFIKAYLDITRTVEAERPVRVDARAGQVDDLFG